MGWFVGNECTVGCLGKGLIERREWRLLDIVVRFWMWGYSRIFFLEDIFVEIEHSHKLHSSKE